MTLRAEARLALAPVGMVLGVVAFVALRRPPPSPSVAPHESMPLAATTSSPLPPPAPIPAEVSDDEPSTLEAQRDALLSLLTRVHGLSADGKRQLEVLFAKSSDIGQGNPMISVHPMSRAECRRVRALEQFVPEDAACGRPNMVRLQAGGTPLKTCIDQYEFPNVPCEFPVVHVRSSEAATICSALGKRLCDSHEWEGACTGSVAPPEVAYDFGRTRGDSNFFHNNKREITWAYGKEKDHRRCATASFITAKCPGGGYGICGSNTYPVGAFAQCGSSIGVYDQHGNVAEHMSLPAHPEQLGGKGQTEMKGSWFVFVRTEAHADDCNFRAPDWHPSTVDAPTSHKNYHLGFRCCSDLP